MKSNTTLLILTIVLIWILIGLAETSKSIINSIVADLKLFYEIFI